MQQSEFARLQRHGYAPQPHLATRGIELDLAGAQFRRRLAACAADKRTQPCGELVQIGRLDEVVVGTTVEATDAVVHTVARGQDQHGQALVLCPQAREEFIPRTAWQAKVEHQCRVGCARQRVFGGNAVARPVDLEARLAQADLQGVAQQRVVFGEQDAHHRSANRRGGQHARRRARAR